MEHNNPIERSREVRKSANRKVRRHISKAALHFAEASTYATGMIVVAAKASELDIVGNLSGIGVAAGMGYISCLSMQDAVSKHTLAIDAIKEGQAETERILDEYIQEQANEHLDNTEDL